MNSITNIGDFSRYGLGGIVIAALFIQAGWFLSALRRKDETNQEFISDLLKADRGERKESRMEHREITNRLASAIDQLSSEIKLSHREK